MIGQRISCLLSLSLGGRGWKAGLIFCVGTMISSGLLQSQKSRWAGDAKRFCALHRARQFHGALALARSHYAAGRPAASSITASVVSGLPPMPHSPLVTSEIFTQVTPRMFSPSIETMASVNFCMICRFCSGLKTFSIRWTSMRASSCSFLLASPERGHSQHARRGQSRL